MAATNLTTNPYLEKFRQAGQSREAIYAEIYDGFSVDEESKLHWVPSRRRQKRIELYRSILGSGHGRILEIGCGLGDLSVGLSRSASRVIGTDVSERVIHLAQKRLDRLCQSGATCNNVVFQRMGATDIRYESGFFDCVVSTSMIEHLHPDDIGPHPYEAYRVLKEGGRYLVWAPNGLGHHGDRHIHLSMLSYGDLVGAMRRAGFRKFQTTFLNTRLLVGVRWKIFLENWFSALGVKWFWRHLGIRNLLLVAEK